MHQNKLKFGHSLSCTSSDDANVGSFCCFVINIYENFGFRKECNYMLKINISPCSFSWLGFTNTSSFANFLVKIIYAHAMPIFLTPTTMIFTFDINLGMSKKHDVGNGFNKGFFLMFETTFVNVKYSKTSSWIVNIGLKSKYWNFKGFVCAL